MIRNKQIKKDYFCMEKTGGKRHKDFQEFLAYLPDEKVCWQYVIVK